MNNKLINKLKQIIAILAQNKNLDFSNPQLPNLLENKIDTPIGDVLTFFSNKKSKFSDKMIDLELLQKLIVKLTKDKSLVRLNHVGFCYKTSSLETEKNKLINLVQQSNVNLYQEESNDEGLWFFIGNIDNWENPVIELFPIGTTNDRYVDYWLPHIQIDVDTKLTAEEIKTTIKLIFGKKITPIPIEIEGITYIIKNRLGVIGGVNIFLDLATNSRNVQYSRQRLWKKIL